MQLQDTTNPKAHRGIKTLMSDMVSKREFEVVSRFRIHLLGVYFAEVGPEWSSNGREESDYVHHVEMVCSGTRQVVHAGKTIDLTPGSAWFLPGATPVKRICNERCRLYFLKFRCEWLPGVDPLLDWPDRHPLRLGRWDERSFRKLWNAKRQLDSTSLFLLQGKLHTWLAESLPSLESIIFGHVKSHGRFEPVFNLIEEKLGADLRVEELASAMRMRLHAFSMAFTRSVGMRPKAYLNRRLNQEAIKLLIRSDAPIKEVALKLRFSDEYYFSRFFKKMNSIPPAPYRNSFQAK